MATAQDLTNFTGHPAPADAARLLSRAQEIIDGATAGNVTAADSQTIIDAVCAQVEFWMETGEEHGILGQTGNVQVAGVGYQAPDQLAPRARVILRRGWLLYRGVGME